MFTEGLDSNAINWINEGSRTDQQPQIRSPLSERFSSLSTLLKSPKPHSRSPHGLPPLKFHSGLIAPHSLVVPRYIYNDKEEEEDDADKESVASASDNGTGSLSEEEVSRTGCVTSRYDEGVVFDYMPSSKLNRGLLGNMNLRIEVPEIDRKMRDDELRMRDMTPGSEGGGELRQRIQMLSAQGNSNYGKSRLREAEDLRTPSAPPILGTGSQEKSLEIDSNNEQIEERDCKITLEADKELPPPPLHNEFGERSNDNKTGDEIQIPYWQDQSSCYSNSGQNAWQILIAYDACIRLCLFAWARGSVEAPEFLRDECLLLRSAFGLHKFLLQPRGVQPTEGRTTKDAEEMCASKTKKVVGKIRVEVRKLRLVPRRKLKSTYSLRGAMYMQVGSEYVRQVSSIVKTGMNSLKLTSFPAVSEDKLSCLFQLKSAIEDDKTEPDSSICLHPGTGDYHVFFPETEGDALLVEVQDKNKAVQGRATIPVSSLNDNCNEDLRWWPIYHDDQECVGKIQLFIGSTITSDEANHVKSGTVVETLAYDLLLEAAMRAEKFTPRKLQIHGPWRWLLTEFADYYGVSDSYTKLRYLSHVMDVATPTKNCLELVHELLVPILKARSERSLTRQEKSIYLDCETQIESLLANVFENYKSLDENSPSGLANMFGPVQESASPALSPAVQVYSLLHDILSQEAQTTLRNYLQTAAKKRCRKHMIETDEFVSSNTEGFLVDSITVSTAYLKMKNLSINIGKEIEADIKINNEHVLPSSVDLSNIAAAVYSTELSRRLRAFLAACPPSSPQPHVNELLIEIVDFERNLGSWSISPVQGGIDSRGLFHDYIMLWVHDMELRLLDRCKAEKIPWSGVMTNHSTSPFAEEMYEKIRDSLIGYEVVISRWPQYSLILENAVAIVERAIVKSLEKQYNDILIPLKDTIPKRLNKQVQKLTGRQSTTLYSVPNQLGTFLNTITRILDVLHCRIDDILKTWASCLPAGDKKSLFGEQMNANTVMLRTKYKTYVQAMVEKLVANMEASRCTRLKRILEELKEEDGENEVRGRMQMICAQLTDSISNLHCVFTSRIFVATCRGFWDRMGQVVLKFLEGRKENRVWYNGSYYALGIVDDIFASQMQRLQGNSLQEKDVEPPRSVVEARSILCRDTSSTTDSSTYFYV